MTPPHRSNASSRGGKPLASTAILSAGADPLAWIDSWARSADLARVVEAFDGEPVGDRGLAAWLEYLEEFSEQWDFRNGQERNLVEARSFTQDVSDVVLAAATALGLRGTTRPARRHYEHVVILGGLVRACIARPQHAANLISDGSVTADRIVGLGGFRPLRGDEEALAADLLDTDVTDEYHAMRAGLEAAFGLAAPIGTRGEESEVVGESWGVTDYVADGGIPVHVVAAPSSEPGTRRANTPDTYAWLAEDSGWLHRGDAVLLVTTDIYAPFQGADAIRMLTVPHGVEVDIVGIQPGAVDPRLAQTFEVHNYLQELRSAIRSLRLLHAKLAG